MSDWVTVKPGEKLEDGPELTGGHTLRAPKKIPWLSYCQRCGHVAGKNYIGRLVSKIGCGYKRDQRYLAWRKNPGSFA